MDVLVQPDGKIVVAGQGGANDIVVTRLNPDGSPDTGFDGDGTIGFDFGGDDYPSGVALQANGRLVVAGHTSVGRNVALVRLDSNGSPDSSFDGDGRKTIDYASERDGASEVLVQPDQKIVVAGSGTLGSDFVVTRLNPDGSPDTGFDGDGTIGVDFGADDFGNAAALQANGKIVVAGDTSGAGDDVAIMRLQPGGSLDTTFSSDGKQTIDFPGDAYGYATALQANGRILVAGEAAGNMLVARLEGDPADSGGGPGGGGPGGGGPGGGPGGGGGFTVPRCAGKRATIVGTSRKDRLRGTRRADVIVALGRQRHHQGRAWQRPDLRRHRQRLDRRGVGQRPHLRPVRQGQDHRRHRQRPHRRRLLFRPHQGPIRQGQPLRRHRQRHHRRRLLQGPHQRQQRQRQMQRRIRQRPRQMRTQTRHLASAGRLHRGC